MSLLEMVMSSSDLQREVSQVFREHFGTTPLTMRLDDIERECRELTRYLDVRSLKSELGDLLASAIMLADECDVDFELLVQATLEKIRGRQKQYKSLGRKVQVAVLGLTGNPVTMGHIRLAQYVLNASRVFDEVWLMPCFAHMFKEGEQMASAYHRLEMARLAARADGRVKVCGFEIMHELSGATVNTVNRMIHDPSYEGKYNFSWIIGMDNANTIASWVDWSVLERMIRFVVCPREGVKRDESVSWYLRSPHIYLGDAETRIGMVSSTEIRNKFPDRHEELDPEVYRYIVENRVYPVFVA
jgi:nicotinate (nicotinamide) nucleotide adenylyltransferase